MKIRKASKKDLKEIIKIVKEFILEHRGIAKSKENTSIEKILKIKKEIFEKDITSKKGIIFLAEDNNKIIGYLFAIKGLLYDRKDKNKIYISDLFVSKNFRKKGIAKKLIKELTSWGKKEKRKEILLDVNINNKNAKKLYSKLKFKDISTKMGKRI